MHKVFDKGKIQGSPLSTAAAPEDAKFGTEAYYRLRLTDLKVGEPALGRCMSLCAGVGVLPVGAERRMRASSWRTLTSTSERRRRSKARC